MAKPEHPGQSDVTVTIDNNPRTIHRGSHTVTELKQLLGVDPVYAIDQVVDGQLTSLADDARITIKGGEVHPDGQRSG
jgi:hypothetical protein